MYVKSMQKCVRIKYIKINVVYILYIIMIEEFDKIHNNACDNINFSIAAFMIKCYSFIQMNVEQCVKKMYTYEPIQSIADNLYYFSYIIKSKFVNYYTEPLDNFWTCVCFTNFNNEKNEYIYDDFYPIIIFEKDKIPDVLTTYNELYEKGIYHHNTKIGEKSQIYECLILLHLCTFNTPTSWEVMKEERDANCALKMRNGVKHYYKCISRICNTKLEKKDMNFAPSSVRFLSLVYSHPKMKNSIDLKIDIMYYLMDNEILSPIFILRLLKYQKLSYVFDKDYTLEVMDDNVNIINLTSDNYIVLEEDKYTVMNM